MSGSILGIHSHNFSDGTEKLLAVWHKTPMVTTGTTWGVAPGLTLTNAKEAHMASFLDQVYLVNGTDSNSYYNGSTFRLDANVADSPIAKYIANYNVKLYLFNITISGTNYPSRCWFSDLPKNDALTWGLETGSDLTQTADSAVVTSSGSLFKTRNVKVGDPFTITNGDNANEYVVQSVDSETQITLTEDMDNTASNSSFWVGGNYFDVETDDGDLGMALAVTSSELLLYKKNSTHRYNSRGKELRKIKSMPGTTSSRGVVVGTDGYAYSYHQTGIYRTLGVNGQLISNPIEDYISGVSDPSSVVAWEENRRYIVFHLGTVTLRDGTSISNCEVRFDHTSNTWSPAQRDRTIKCATNWLKNSTQEVYAGDDSDGVFKLNTGYAWTAGSTDIAINFELETKDIFPAGSEAIVSFDRLRAYIDNGLDVQIMYKLIYQPKNEYTWITDKDWKPLKGSQRGDRSEWYFPTGSRASGVRLKFVESSVDESFLWEKAVLYYSNVANR